MTWSQKFRKSEISLDTGVTARPDSRQWWLESNHVFHKITQLESESLLRNLWTSDGQTQIVCI